MSNVQSPSRSPSLPKISRNDFNETVKLPTIGGNDFDKTFSSTQPTGFGMSKDSFPHFRKVQNDPTRSKNAGPQMDERDSQIVQVVKAKITDSEHQFQELCNNNEALKSHSKKMHLEMQRLQEALLKSRANEKEARRRQAQAQAQANTSAENLMQFKAQVSQLQQMERENSILQRSAQDKLSKENEKLKLLLKSAELSEAGGSEVLQQAERIEKLSSENEKLKLLLKSADEKLQSQVKDEKDQVAYLEARISELSELCDGSVENEKPQSQLKDEKLQNASLVRFGWKHVFSKIKIAKLEARIMELEEHGAATGSEGQQQAERSSSENESLQLQLQLKDEKVQVAKLEAQISELTKTTAATLSHSQVVEKLSERLSSESENLQQQAEKLSSENENLHFQLKDEKVQVAKLEAQISELTKIIAATGSETPQQAATLSSENEKLQLELKDETMKLEARMGFQRFAENKLETQTTSLVRFGWKHAFSKIKIAKLEAQISDLTKLSASTSPELQQQAERLSRENEKLQTELKDEKVQVTNLEARISKLLELAEASSAEVEQQTERISTKVEKLQSELKDEKVQVAKLEARISELTKTSRGTSTEMEQQAEKLFSENQKLQSEIQNEMVQLKEKKLQNGKLEAHLRQQIELFRARTTSMVRFGWKHAFSKIKIAKLEEQILDLKKLSASTSPEVQQQAERLSRENEKLQTELKDEKVQVTYLEERISELSELCEASGSEGQQQAERLSSENEQLQSQLKDEKVQVAKLEAQISELTKTSAATGSEIQNGKLEAHLRQQIELFQARTTSLVRFGWKHAFSKIKIAKLEAQILDLKKLSAATGSEGQQAERLSSENEKLQSELKDAKVQVAKLEAQISEQAELSAATGSEMQQLAERLKTSAATGSEVLQQAERLFSENEKLQSQLKDEQMKNGKLEAGTTSLVRFGWKHAFSKIKIAKLEAQISELREISASTSSNVEQQAERSNEIEKLQSQLKDNEIEKLQSQLKDEKIQNGKLQTRVASLARFGWKNVFTEVQRGQKTETSSSENETLQLQLKNEKVQVAKLEAQISELAKLGNSSGSALQQQAERLSSEKEQLQVLLKDEKLENAKLQARIGFTKLMRAEDAKRLLKLKGENENLQMQLKENECLQKQLKDEKVQVTYLEARISELSELCEASGSDEKLKNALTDEKLKNAQLETRISELLQMRLLLELEMKLLTEASGSSDPQVQQQAEKLSSENAKLQLLLKDAESRAANSKAQISEWIQISDESGYEVERLREALLQFQALVQSKNSEVERLLQALRSTQEKLIKSEARQAQPPPEVSGSEALVPQLDELQSRISQLVHVIDSDSGVQHLEDALLQSPSAKRNQARNLLVQARTQAEVADAAAGPEVVDAAAGPEDAEVAGASPSNKTKLLGPLEVLSQTQAADADAVSVGKVGELETRVARMLQFISASGPEVQRLQEALDQSQASDAEARELLVQAWAQVAQMKTELQHLQEALEKSQAGELEARDLFKKLQQEHSQLTIRHSKCDEKEKILEAKLKTLEAKLKDAGEKLMPVKREGRVMSECIQLILQRLMDDPKYGCSTSTEAWTFFEPEVDSGVSQVNCNRFRDKIHGLNILTENEVSGLIEYIDSGSGFVDYDEWKAGVIMALAASGELHALPTEEEFNAVMFRIQAKMTSKGMKSVKAGLESCGFDTSKSFPYDEFMKGMLQLKVGLSQKEVTQIYFSMNPEDEGIEIDDVDEAVEEGAEADVMKQVTTSILRQVGVALSQKTCVEKCEELATAIGSPSPQMLSFDGFVQLIRIGHPEMTLSSIMRLWCSVDKCGQGGLGYANVPDLVSNILAATMR